VGGCGGNHVGVDVHLPRTSHLSIVKFGEDDGRKSGKSRLEAKITSA